MYEGLAGVAATRNGSGISHGLPSAGVQVRMYEGNISETMLVTQFVLGLKEELRAAVEMQLPTTVAHACEYALVQEALLDMAKQGSNRTFRSSTVTKPQSRPDQTPRSQLAAGDMWKARQLKDYRRQNGLCYSCGDKFAPGHVCANKQVAQAKALHMAEEAAHLSDAVLDAIATEEAVEEAAAHLSVNALAGTTNTKTIQIRALVGNQVMLLLVDSGSSHTFIDQQLADKL